ncbi:hypothetical protein SAMN05660443_0207 [Marinospirillum celere]|uniref:Pentapeptide repeat-containing protein n=1 Tax=Marinospirillum celere TaxID=1122252 RepID=A0A1I1DYL9_9GAMM|nr:hypothetical protein [Marinospirillum celere]SFB80035.1 hypothetical protein SAMN05660443_0207 [Marinospirillum celere]
MGRCEHQPTSGADQCCERDAFLNGKCVLHCEKDEFFDAHKGFENQVNRYIYDDLRSRSDSLLKKWSGISGVRKNIYNFEEAMINYICSGDREGNIDKIIKDQCIILKGISFPRFIQGVGFVSTLSKFHGVEFADCNFTCEKPFLKKALVGFQKCDFKSGLSLTAYCKSLFFPAFINCCFSSDVTSENEKEGISIGFSGCDFKGNMMSFKGISSDEDAVIINSYNIGRFYLKGASFKGGFKVSGSKFNYFSKNDAVFEKNVCFDRSSFCFLEMHHVNFNQLFSFERNLVSDKGKKSVFGNVMFNSHAIFREAIFSGGLDLDRANFSGEANFLGVDVDGGDIANTTRETYRLIKHSFDNIGNHLEANKFFAKEMDKYREELDEERTRFSDVFRHSQNGTTFAGRCGRWASGMNSKIPIYWLNKIFSDFGQNYLLSVGWLLLFMVAYFYTFVLHRHLGLLHSESSCDVFGNWYDKVNCLASGMIPFKDFLTQGMELLSLLFYLIFAVLVWQTVVALKRHTRR